jgi:hypothetical protein
VYVDAALVYTTFAVVWFAIDQNAVDKSVKWALLSYLPSLKRCFHTTLKMSPLHRMSGPIQVTLAKIAQPDMDARRNLVPEIRALARCQQ